MTPDWLFPPEERFGPWYEWLAKPDYVNVGTAVGAVVAGFTLSIWSEGDDLLWLIFLAIVAVVNLYVAIVNAARRRYEAYRERMTESDVPEK